jgi:hypothetical protein
MEGDDMTTLLSAATASMERANHTVVRIGERLISNQGDVADLRTRIASLALVATIDPTHEPELAELRSKLGEAEARARELGAAEQLAQNMAREARERALAIRRDSDWAAADDLLHEALTIAGELDEAIGRVGSLYQELLRKQQQAVGHVRPHVSNDRAFLIQPPPMNDTLRLVLSNSGALPADPAVSLHLDAFQRSAASITGVVQHHREHVLTYRPIDMTKEEPSHDD